MLPEHVTIDLYIVPCVGRTLSVRCADPLRTFDLMLIESRTSFCSPNMTRSIEAMS